MLRSHAISASPYRRPRLVVLALLCVVLVTGQPAAHAEAPGPPSDIAALAGRDRALIDASVAAMPAPAADAAVLYIVGFAGDGTEDVFRNEIRFLETGVAPRLDAGERVLALVNHADSLEAAPRALATKANLRHALTTLGTRMRRDDLLLLYLTTHGTPDHRLALSWPPLVDERIAPKELRAMLDTAGIGRRILVVSACYSGGFIPALRSPDTLVITAAQADRPSFGCGSESTITFFGHAWLLDGLNAERDFIAAYRSAARAIGKREAALDYPPSRPRIDVGARIRPALAQWSATLPTDAPVAVYPYPYPID